MADDARAVRIPRPSRPDRTPRVPGVGAAAPLLPNTSGSVRAMRLFLVFVLGLVALLAVFSILFAQAAGGLSSNLGAEGFIGLIAVGLAVYAGWATLGQTPRSIRDTGDGVVVGERFGHERRYSRLQLEQRTVARRNSEGWFGPSPTELVGVRDEKGRVRFYLLDASLLSGYPRRKE